MGSAAGLDGGSPGSTAENWLVPAGDESLPDKCTINVQAGVVIRLLTPSGGGWGPPEVRPA